MCQFFSHFLAVMRYRDAFGMISGYLRNLYCPQKWILSVLANLKLCQLKVERETWANTLSNGVIHLYISSVVDKEPIKLAL